MKSFLHRPSKILFLFKNITIFSLFLALKTYHGLLMYLSWFCVDLVTNGCPAHASQKFFYAFVPDFFTRPVT